MFPIRDLQRLPGTALVTVLLLLANAFVFYLELTSNDIERLILEYSLVPANFSLGNPESWLDLITYQFLHGGWFHFLSNMWFLAVFGPNVEKAWGSMKFLIYYLLSGIAAAFLQLLFITESAPMLGASGAIAGVLGAYFFYFPHHRIQSLILLGIFPLFLAVPAGIMLLYWFGLQLAGGFLATEPGIAFFAHIGGFFAGIILAAATHPVKAVKGHVANL